MKKKLVFIIIISFICSCGGYRKGDCINIAIENGSDVITASYVGYSDYVFWYEHEGKLKASTKSSVSIRACEK